jgi:hypothetical protein
MALAALERLTTIEEPGVNLSAPGSDTVMCEGGTVMTTLAVLAALVAAPVLFCVLLAVALAGVMALHFGRGWLVPVRMIEECLELTSGRSGGKETTRMYEACLDRQLAAQG